MLERMTIAEDMGYNDSYFPMNNEDEQHYGTDPNEYILAHSPPTSPRDLLLTVDSPPDDQERDRREREGEAAADADEARAAAEERERERETESSTSPRGIDVPVVPSSFESDEEEPILAPADREHKLIETGTHMSPEHPGYLEHVPSVALSPDQLHPDHPDRQQELHRHLHQHDESPSQSQSQSQSQSRNRDREPMVITRQDAIEHQRAFTGQSQMFKQQRRRTKSFSDRNPVAEAVFYSYGVSVFFGFTETQEKEIMEDCLNAGAWSRPQEEDEWEVEECHYVVSLIPLRYHEPCFGATC